MAVVESDMICRVVSEPIEVIGKLYENNLNI